MKKYSFFALILALALVLGACGAETPVQTTQPETTEALQVKEVFTFADMTDIDHTEKNLNFNNVDFTKQPHFTNRLGIEDYIRNCIANRCRNIVFSCEKKAMVEILGSDFCETYMVAWCNPKVEPGEAGIHYMITITYYPGDNVAWAYLNNDTSTLTTEEQQLYDVAVAWLDANITGEMTDYEKCETIYRYLSGNVRYSNDLLNALNTSYTFDLGITAYGAMIDQLTICQGYADAFDMLTSMLGMECQQVYGKGSGEPHNWNLIQLEGNWYHVDCTWGAAFGGVDGRCSWAYFLPSDSQIGRTHSWDRELFPKAQDDSLFYYTKLDLYVTNEEELEAKVGAVLAEGGQAEVYVKNMTQKQLKDYLEPLGATWHLKEYSGDIILCAWMPEA